MVSGPVNHRAIYQCRCPSVGQITASDRAENAAGTKVWSPDCLYRVDDSGCGGGDAVCGVGVGGGGGDGGGGGGGGGGVIVGVVGGGCGGVIVGVGGGGCGGVIVGVGGCGVGAGGGGGDVWIWKEAALTNWCI